MVLVRGSHFEREVQSIPRGIHENKFQTNQNKTNKIKQVLEENMLAEFLCNKGKRIEF